MSSSPPLLVVFANGKIEKNGRLLRGFVFFNASRRLSRVRFYRPSVVVEDLRALCRESCEEYYVALRRFDRFKNIHYITKTY